MTVDGGSGMGIALNYNVTSASMMSREMLHLFYKEDSVCHEEIKQVRKAQVRKAQVPVPAQEKAVAGVGRVVIKKAGRGPGRVGAVAGKAVDKAGGSDGAKVKAADRGKVKVKAWEAAASPARPDALLANGVWACSSMVFFSV